MSEADSPNKESGLTESVASVTSVPIDPSVSGKVPEFVPEDDWQTVDFPGAMSVDAIPLGAEPSATTSTNQDSEVLAALASLTPPPDAAAIASGPGEPESVAPAPASDGTGDGESGDRNADPTLVQRLQQESQELRDRLAQLEQDLAQQQIELQLEMARSLHQTAPEMRSPEPPVSETVATTPAIGTGQLPVAPELTMGQGRINQLFHELELAQQTAQRQQILVETLSEQLESSQERIAQLERDCALAQQRYNEQIQQLLQTETTCRDLRMRLHRQQQQTLQFKAALEKCLEMPAPSTHFIATADAGTPLAIPAVPIVPTPLTTGLAPKNQPVRPWVAPVGQEQHDWTDSNLPKPLSKLLNSDPAIAPAIKELESQNWLDSTEEAQTAVDWVNQIFSNATDPAYTPTPIDPKTGIFDLSPFLESGETASPAAMNATASSPESTVPDAPITDAAKDVGLLQMLASVPLASDELVASQPFGWGGKQSNDDPVWDDLAKLIDPANPNDTTSANQVEQAIAPTLPFPNQASTASAAMPFADGAQGHATPPAAENPTVSSTSTTSKTSKKPLELISWVARSQRTTGQSVPPQTESQVIGSEPLEPATASSETATFEMVESPSPDVSNAASNLPSQHPSSQEPGAASWPSPIVYPLRPTKKLKSLSAVDLPTFPKAR